MSLKVCCTFSASSFLSTPLFTKMQVSCLPMALCTSTAATEESTPPDRPQTAWLLPTAFRISPTE